MDNRGCFPLHLAAWSSNVEICQLLLTNGPSLANANEQNTEGDTALHTAAQYGHTDVVSVLLENFADPGVRNKKDETPLDLAAQYGRLETVDLLITHSRHLLSNCSITHTPLHLASRNGHKQVVERLLSAGFDVNTATEYGSALHEAAFYGKTDVVKVLLSFGVDTNLQNQEGKTALELVNSQTSTRSQEIALLIKRQSYRYGDEIVITSEPSSYDLISQQQQQRRSLDKSNQQQDSAQDQSSVTTIPHSQSLYENVSSSSSNSIVKPIPLPRQSKPPASVPVPVPGVPVPRPGKPALPSPVYAADSDNSIYAIEQTIKNSMNAKTERCSSNSGDELYQVPPSARRSHDSTSFQLYKVPPPANRGSVSSSERHSESYDVPPTARYSAATTVSSGDDTLYQVPPSSGGVRTYSNCSDNGLYQIPSRSRQTSTASYDSCNLYQVPPSSGGRKRNSSDASKAPPVGDDGLYQVPPSSCRRPSRCSESDVGLLNEVPPSPTQKTDGLYQMSFDQSETSLLSEVPPSPTQTNAPSGGFYKNIPPPRKSSIPQRKPSLNSQSSLYDVPPAGVNIYDVPPAGVNNTVDSMKSVGYIPMDQAKVTSKQTMSSTMEKNFHYQNIQENQYILHSPPKSKQSATAAPPSGGTGDSQRNRGESEEENQYMIHSPKLNESNSVEKTEEMYMNSEQLKTARNKSENSMRKNDETIEKDETEEDDSYFINTGVSFTRSSSTVKPIVTSSLLSDNEPVLYQNPHEVRNDSDGVYELLCFATSGQRETVESHDVSSGEEEEVQLEQQQQQHQQQQQEAVKENKTKENKKKEAPPPVAAKPISKPPSLEFNQQRSSVEFPGGSPSSYIQPPTPDHPPPSPQTAISGIIETINLNMYLLLWEKRRSRDLETSSAADTTTPVTTETIDEGQTADESETVKYSDENPFIGLLKGSKPKGLKRAKTIYGGEPATSAVTPRVKRNSTPGLFYVAFDPLLESPGDDVFVSPDDDGEQTQQSAVVKSVRDRVSDIERNSPTGSQGAMSPLRSPVSESSDADSAVETPVKLRKQKSTNQQRDESDEWNEIADIMATFGGRITNRESVFMNDFDKEFAKLISGAGKVISVGDWLESMKLEQYENLFIANGFDNMDFMAPNVLEEADILEMGIYNETHRGQILGAVKLMSPVPSIGMSGKNEEDSEDEIAVDDWLKSLSLSEYIDTFHKHDFTTMNKVRKLWELELTTVLDITRLGHRKRILASLGGHLADESLEELGQTVDLRNLPTSFSSDSTESWSLNPLIRDSDPDVSLFRDYTGITPFNPPGTDQHQNATIRSPSNDSSPDSDLDSTKQHQQQQQQQRNISYSNIDMRPPNATMTVKSDLIKGWHHTPDVLIKGCCNYNAHYLGSTLVKELNGLESTKESIVKMKLRYWERLKRMTDSIQKVPSIILSIFYRGVKFIDAKSKNVICEHEIGNIFCACQDADDMNFFAYITKDLQTGHHYCHVFRVKTTDRAAEIILTLGEAFEVAYQIAKLEEQANNADTSPPASPAPPAAAAVSMGQQDEINPSVITTTINTISDTSDSSAALID
ncbi:uncharacterized protein LOC141913248 isoform X2 [Tubulanus polymorphus]|uniref:uncharacterized protein LOC141913248 isoform X2 n=1 Tax=Tubulanus polymorphus TaxID=672921 RepID=UPI003DA2633E